MGVVLARRQGRLGWDLAPIDAPGSELSGETDSELGPALLLGGAACAQAPPLVQNAAATKSVRALGPGAASAVAPGKSCFLDRVPKSRAALEWVMALDAASCGGKAPCSAVVQAMEEAADLVL